MDKVSTSIAGSIHLSIIFLADACILTFFLLCQVADDDLTFLLLLVRLAFVAPETCYVYRIL